MQFKEFPLTKLGHEIQLIGAIWQGDGCVYFAMFPGEEGWSNPSEIGDVAHELNMSSTEWEQFIAQTDKMETEVLAKAPDGSLTKVLFRKSQRQIEQHIAWECYRRDGYKCRYCGADNVPLTVDHLVLFEEGGPGTKANLLSSCRRCNKTRGRTQYSAWLQSDYYKRVSRNLTEEQRRANAELVATLDSIPRVYHVRSR